MLRIYKLPELRRYSAGTTSSAFFFDTCVVLLIIILPILVAQYSHDFYITEYTYPEKPFIEYGMDWFLMIQTDKENWYSSPQPWKMKEAQYISSSIRYRENEDEALHLTIQIPLQATEQIQGVVLMLAFNIQLHRYTQLYVNLPTITTLTPLIPVGGVEFVGELTVKQTDILPTIGEKNLTRIDYKTPGLNNLKNILHYFSSPRSSVYGHIAQKLLEWKPPEPSSSLFTIQTTIRYGSSRLTVRPGFWFTIKFAWIQYLSIALIFIYAGQKLREYAYGYQLVATEVSSTLSSISKHELW